MARTKTDRSVWGIFFETLKIFCMNIHKFILFMAFPVLGQVVGLFLVFGLTFWFNSNLSVLIEKYPVMNNLSSMSTVVILLALPGLLILMKAFWDYLVAYVALNSMTDGALTTGRVYDFPAHRAVANSRKFSFIGLWLLFGIFTAVSTFPLFWILGGIFFIYFILIFQVFTFEDGLTPVECFKRSLELVKGRFARTVLLLVFVGGVSYLVYQGLTVVFEVVRLNMFMLGVFETWAMSLPLDQVNAVWQKFGGLITPNMIAHECLASFTMFVALGFTLPIRSIAWTLWYDNLNALTNTEEKRAKKKRKTKQKKLDKNVLKRAMEDDDEE